MANDPLEWFHTCFSTQTKFSSMNLVGRIGPPAVSVKNRRTTLPHLYPAAALATASYVEEQFLKLHYYYSLLKVQAHLHDCLCGVEQKIL